MEAGAALAAEGEERSAWKRSRESRGDADIFHPVGLKPKFFPVSVHHVPTNIPPLSHISSTLHKDGPSVMDGRTRFRSERVGERIERQETTARLKASTIH
jgi:hypothetical protein